MSVHRPRPPLLPFKPAPGHAQCSPLSPHLHGTLQSQEHPATLRPQIGVPFYGSYDETDPARLVSLGVERLREAKRDLIIVDTSGRHKQSEALFEEMRAVAAVAKPTLTVFVMDGSIGQAAFDQADAFR